LVHSFVISFIIICFVLYASLSWAVYKVYLTGGRIIAEVEEISENNGTTTLQKNGITLNIQKSIVQKIEEYIPIKTFGTAKGPAVLEADDELPVNLKSDERIARKPVQQDGSEIRELIARHELITQKLERIIELENKSKELENRIYRSLRLLSPKKARVARKEKKENDRKLEQLKKEQTSLLKEKEEIERTLGDKGINVLQIKDEEEYGEESLTEIQELSDYELKTLGPGIVQQEKFLLDLQLKDLQKRDQAGELPGQFKPYKEFLEKQQKQLQEQ
jgi:hypothetical protein